MRIVFSFFYKDYFLRELFIIVNIILIITLPFNNFRFNGIFFIDKLSIVLLFLRIWVFSFSWYSISIGKVTKFLVILIEVFSIIRFSIYSYFIFYISFESTFIILFVFLLMLGKNMERIQSSFYIFFYTIVFSLPFLILLIDLKSISDGYFFINFYDYKKRILWIFIFIIFLVKIPVYGVHLWLPKAHVESPILGSMVLAGIILKLGFYGLFRHWGLIKSKINTIIFRLIFIICLLGGIMITINCIIQTDLKIIIAYSSIVHIRISLLGIIRINRLGIEGCLLRLISHGFISPILFFIITICYNNFNSRRVLILKSYLILNPIIFYLWFIFMFINLGVPPFISFFAEFYILSSLSFISLNELLIIIIISLTRGIYCIIIFLELSHGKKRNSMITHSFTHINYLPIYIALFILIFYILFFFI